MYVCTFALGVLSAGLSACVFSSVILYFREETRSACVRRERRESSDVLMEAQCWPYP